MVGVTWEIPDDADVEDTSRLRGDKASARIAEIVAKLAGTAGVELLEYNHDLIRIVATTILFTIEQPTAKHLKIVVQDDGRGLDSGVTDLVRLFEKGFTTTNGSGLGLFHVTQILEDLGGSITAERTPAGARFVIRITHGERTVKKNAEEAVAKS